jgi:hypothetical protein
MGRIGSDCPRSSGNDPKHRYFLGAYGTRNETAPLASDWIDRPEFDITSRCLGKDDRSNYNNKMALLDVLLEGAKERAQDNGDIETLCLLLSVVTNFTANYVNIAPNNQQINQRLVSMNRDLNMCFNMLKKTALKP